MTIRTNTLLAACAVFMLAVAPHAEAQASLSAARDLYASAAYTEALVMLNGLAAGERPREERQMVDLYRTLCLLALGRKAEADSMVDAMIVQDPLYRPASDVPPRMRSAFSAARKRLLPSILQQKYIAAKAAFDRKDFAAAAGGFQQVLNGLADPDIAPAATQPPLADLRTLADGFYDLSAKAVAPAVSARPPAPVRAAAGPAPDLSHVYGAHDRNVVPPVTVRQAIPRIRGKVPTSGEAVVELVIDTRGAVESVRMAVPLNATFDQEVLIAAKLWQYQPAMLDGVPVRYRKQVKVSVAPPPAR
jgi:TonB family protein